MTARSLLGLAALNAFVLVVGAGLLWGIRGWRSWFELLRLAGLAYMLGVAGLGIALTLVLVVGVPFGPTTVLLTGAVVAFAGVGVGRALRRPRPVLRDGQGQGLSLTAAAFAAMIVVYLEALFRAVVAKHLRGRYAFAVDRDRSSGLGVESNLVGRDREAAGNVATPVGNEPHSGPITRRG